MADKKTYRSWHPPKWTNAQCVAIQAVAAGVATEGQQVLAMQWIIEQASGYTNLSYSPDSDRDTCFAEGRRFVGLQLVKLIKIKVGMLKDSSGTTEEKEHG